MTTIKDIITAFHKGRFSEITRNTFYRWFISDYGRDEKDRCMEEVWETSGGVVSDKTVLDLQRLNSRIRSIRKRKERTAIRLWQCAAALLLVSFAGYLLYRPLKPSDAAARSPKMEMVSVPYGQLSDMSLPDGTHVWVNGGSIIFYPQDFGQEIREVFLYGQGRFEVAKDASRPFIVKTAGMDVKALGTIFSIHAFSDDKFVSASLEEGAIEVSTPKGDIYSLTPDECLTIDRLTGKVSVTEIDATRAGLWHDGYLVFDDEDLPTILSAIERKYKKEIFFVSSKYAKHRYSARFHPDESLEEVLGILHKLADLNYIIDGDRIYIK